MHRIWLGMIAAGAFLVWLLFFQAVFVLVVIGAAVGAVWILWEVYALKKAMRTPPQDRR